jgi:hypothetical protein
MKTTNDSHNLCTVNSQSMQLYMFYVRFLGVKCHLFVLSFAVCCFVCS